MMKFNFKSKEKKGGINKLVLEETFGDELKYEIYVRADGTYQIFIYRMVEDLEIEEKYWSEIKNGAEIHICDNLENAQLIAKELIKQNGR